MRGGQGQAAGGGRTHRAGWRLASARSNTETRARGVEGVCSAANARGQARCARSGAAAGGARKRQLGLGDALYKRVREPGWWGSACSQCLSRRVAQSGVWMGPRASVRGGGGLRPAPTVGEMPNAFRLGERWCGALALYCLGSGACREAVILHFTSLHFTYAVAFVSNQNLNEKADRHAVHADGGARTDTPSDYGLDPGPDAYPQL